MPSGLQSDGRWLCKPCGDFFATWEALLDHKQQMRQAGQPRHIHCKHCGVDFKTGRAEIFHIQTVGGLSRKTCCPQRRGRFANVEQLHPQAQNLTCVVCGQGPFVRVAGLIAHIEEGQCTSLDSFVIDQRREKKTEFSRNLEVLTKEPIKNSFAKYIRPSQVPSASHVHPSTHGTSMPSSASHPGQGVIEPRSVNVPTKMPGSEEVTDWFTSLDSSKQAVNVDAKPAGSSGVVNPMVKTEVLNPMVKTEVLEPRTVDAPTKLPGSEGVTDWFISLDSSKRPVNVGAGSSGVVNSMVKTDNLVATDSVANWGGAESEKASGGVMEKTLPPNGPVLGSETSQSMDPDHPDHPSFKSARYYSPYADGYICPKTPCG